MSSIANFLNQLGCWNTITCVNSHNLDLIEHNLVSMFKKEGCRQISKPPLPKNPKPLLRELCSSYRINNLFVIGLSLGNFGWTIIKSSSDNLFCNRAKNSFRPRISELAILIDCDAFTYQFYDFFLGALLEADASGKTFVSGYLDNTNSITENDIFCSEQVNYMATGLNFILLNKSNELKLSCQKNEISKEGIQNRIDELDILVEQHPEKINYALSEYKKIHKSRFVRDNEHLGEILCKSDSFWHEDQLLYQAFANPQKLEANGVRLLFFQSKRFDLNPKTEEIWSPIISQKNYGVEQDLLW